MGTVGNKMKTNGNGNWRTQDENKWGNQMKTNGNGSYRTQDENKCKWQLWEIR